VTQPLNRKHYPPSKTIKEAGTYLQARQSLRSPNKTDAIQMPLSLGKVSDKVTETTNSGRSEHAFILL
jgi:hypothetical protein